MMYLQDFADGNATQKSILGGKGANLAEMTTIGVPVPQGFTITCQSCIEYQKDGDASLPPLWKEVNKAVDRLAEITGKRLGDNENPLLLSVRSGSPVSMPGMMDTVLNLGLNDLTASALLKKTANPKFVLDTHRRFVQMFSDVVMGVDHHRFEAILADKRKEAGVENDNELSEAHLKALLAEYFALYQSVKGEPFPTDPIEQLRLSILAVFKSWNTSRARTYRRMENIPDDLGTAVNVQAMVFGNTGERSGSGVVFTRNPATGEKELYGEFLQNAQGEDVVAGIRTPIPIIELKKSQPVMYDELLDHCNKLENHFADMQDVEFTVEEDEMFILQTRSAKRTGIAALRSSVEFHEEGLIDDDEAVRRVSPEHFDHLLFPVFEPNALLTAKEDGRVMAQGLNAGPGAASGLLVLSSEEAVEVAATGSKVVLVRTETSPDDIAGMAASEGFVTARGGMTSHAAVVARGMGKPCVAGAGELIIDESEGFITANGKRINRGEWISLDGFTGEVFVGNIPSAPSELVRVLVTKTLEPEESPLYQLYAKLDKWVENVRVLGVRANADTPEDARASVSFGAQGIGLTRTEHMFFGEGRLQPVREMIMSATDEERATALAKLLPLQRGDFEGLLEAMGGMPVTIRLLDPPLHEFLPHSEDELIPIASEMGLELEVLKRRVEGLAESNPMLGHRGCRLGVTHPEVYDMQVRAIAEAMVTNIKSGGKANAEIMIPLVGTHKELDMLRKRAENVLTEVSKESNLDLDPLIGTMIELPRAALTADEVAEHADFFSFGTNDLTQTTWGLSRDDAGTFLPRYVDKDLIPADPFVQLDIDGVGQLVTMAVEKGRTTRPDIKLGICGEHGGEPTSIDFCYKAGLDYVSCSPFRVPVARLVAAQCELKYGLRSNN